MIISVIIPTFKPQDYIWECLYSLFNQTFSKEDFEVIIVLNGCSEPWKSKIENYIAEKMHGMNINYIHTEEGGVSNARNIALDVIKGDYVTFIDDDDYVSPTYLEDLYEFADKDTISISDAVSFDDETKQIEYPNALHEDFLKKIKGTRYTVRQAKKFFSAPVRKLISKEIIGEYRFDSKFKNGEDTLFCFLISHRVKYVTPTKGSAIYYRRCRSNSAHFRKKTRKEKFILGRDLFVEMCKYYFKSPREYDFFFFITNTIYSIYFSLIYLFFYIFNYISFFFYI